jgi:hypothetical protein
METLAALVPKMMPYYLDKSARPTYQIRASASARAVVARSSIVQ